MKFFPQFTAALRKPAKPKFAVSNSQFAVILRDDGILISKAESDGRVVNREVKTLKNWPTKPWAAPINIEVQPVADSLEGHVALWIVQPHSTSESEAAESMKVMHGSPEAVALVSGLIQQAWFEYQRNPSGVQQPVAAAEQAFQPTFAHVRSGLGAQASPTSYTPPPAAKSGWRLSRVAMMLAGGVLVLGGAYAGASYYLMPKGPGIDLSSMSIDDISTLDANPAAVKSIQSGLIAAMGEGQSEAARNGAKIEADHIAALKAMGLDPGKSMQNAMSCLADRKS